MALSRRIIQPIRSSLVLMAVTLATAWAVAETPQPSLVERLGFPPDARVLIINADDFGMNQAATEGTIDVLRAGAVTSATVMVPCPWLPLAASFARKHPQANIGVHLTHTSEWGAYKWGPVLGSEAAPGLVDKLGYMHPDVGWVYSFAKPEEAEREARAQVEKALAAGIDVTHIDSHMGTLQYNPKFHEAYLRVARDFRLPCRMAGRDVMTKLLGGYLRDMADEFGVLCPDKLFLDEPPSLEATEAFWKKRIRELPAGKVSEIYIHCGQDTPEMRATTGSWARRTADTEF
ncbi:MAG TPA: polysaccharide deacetylase family protein, partial [Candidatus Hydrogenedentes bacterium]|nr:polysaccharide deacetylase family protein [Candidatus Hydrogenedentota bacterium]